MIDQVLNNSLGYHEIQLKKESVDANDYLNTVLDDFLLSVNDKNVSIKRSLLENSKEVFIDKFFLTTALFNILENAAKYSGDNVSIEFSLKATSVLSISIQDSGIGIATKDQKLLFDKFLEQEIKKYIM